MFQKCFHTEVCQRRSEEYRCQLTFAYQLLVKICTCAVQKLNLIQKLCFLLAKDVKKKGEEAKVAVRNVRRDGNVAFKKLKGTEISEDEIKDLEDELQKITDKYVAKIDKMVEAKSKEIMTV